jgi:predicted Rossmann fold flavoprotein
VISHGKEIRCDAVILAVGGASYPATGSTGDGYLLAESAGHTIVPIRPALVPLEISGDIPSRLAGLTLRNINLAMIINGKSQKKAFGELEFSESGVTGPITLSISNNAVDALREGHKVDLSIDLKPALDQNKLDARLLRDISARSKETFKVFLRDLLPAQMIPVCGELTGIPLDLIISNMTAKQRGRLRTWLKDFRLEVTGHRPFTEAIITAGGVNTREINPRTMESVKTKGLFIAGELLDIQADTGGYNLQAAFSTGWLAGISAAQQIMD